MRDSPSSRLYSLCVWRWTNCWTTDLTCRSQEARRLGRVYALGSVEQAPRQDLVAGGVDEREHHVARPRRDLRPVEERPLEAGPRLDRDRDVTTRVGLRAQCVQIAEPDRVLERRERGRPRADPARQQRLARGARTNDRPDAERVLIR